MRKININNLVSVFQVSDMEKSLEWYQKWLGEPDVVPVEGVAEYHIAPNAWLQLSCGEENEQETSAIVLGVEDAAMTKKRLEECGIETGEMMDYEVVLVFDIFDLDGNKITFAQEISN